MPSLFNRCLCLAYSIAGLIVVAALPVVCVHAQQQSPVPSNNQPTPVNSSADRHQFSAKTSVDINSAYVGEQVLVTVEVLAPTSAFNVRQQKMKLPGADIYVLQKKTVDDGKYRSVSTRYAVSYTHLTLPTTPYV